MSAIAEPAPGGAEQAAATIITRHRGQALRRMPAKAKVGAAILGVFIVVAIIGPTIAPFDPSATTVGQALPTAPGASHLLGITIDHWVGLDFSAFKSAVDAVGGITVNVPDTFTDYQYPADIPITTESSVAITPVSSPSTTVERVPASSWDSTS